MDTQPMLRAIIVDDERLARGALRRLLAAHEGVEVVGEAGRVAEAAALVQAHRPDLVFLDVQMRGETGFDLLAHPDVQAVAFRIVFVTAFDQYAVRAFDVHALDYLLKPIDPPRLAEALARARTSTAPAAAPTPPTASPGAEGGGRLRLDDLFFYEEGRHPRFIRIRDVAFIRAAGNYTELHLADGDHVLVHKPLAAWEEALPPEHFVQVHRSVLVHVAFVERVERAPNYTYDLYLRGFAAPVPMSRRRASALKRRLSNDALER